MFRHMVWISAALCFVPLSWAQGPLTVQPARKHVTLTGYTRSRSKMAVASEVAGKVVQVHYDVGMIIGSKPFVEIDPTFIDFQIRQVRGSLERLANVRARNASRAVYLEKEFQRIDRLHKGDVATEASWDASAEALAQARLEERATDIEINTLNTQLAELKERRVRHKVIAPQGWVVVARMVEPGEIMAQGAPLAKVADFRQLVVPLVVSSEELAAIEQAPKLTVRLGGRLARADLHWVNPQFDEHTRKLSIELILDHTAGVHRGGLLVELSLDIAANGLMVPKAAVSNRYENPRVTVKSDGRSVPIVILGENGEYTLIAQSKELPPGTELQPQSPAP